MVEREYKDGLCLMYTYVYTIFDVKCILFKANACFNK